MHKGVRFTEHDVSRDYAAANEMVRRSGQTGVPVILIDDQPIVGFNRPRLEQILAQAGARRPSLGVRVADAKAMAGKVPGLTRQDGAYVGAVTPGSPAAAAGVGPGDLIVAVDGRPILGAADLEREAAAGRGRLVLTLLRQGRPQQVAVNL